VNAAAHRLRQEATVLRSTSRTVWRESEELLRRATRLNAEADRLEQEADDAEVLERAREFIGETVRMRTGRGI
jgi:cell division protein FtsB